MIGLPPEVVADGWAPERKIQTGGLDIFEVVHEDGRRAVLKVAPSGRDDSLPALLREALALEHLRPAAPLSLPRLWLRGERYTVQEFCPGRRLAPGDELSASEVDLLARSLRALRWSAVPPAIGTAVPEPRTAFWRLALKTVAAVAPEFVSRREGVALLRRARRLLPALAAGEGLSHGDFTLTNVFLDADRVYVTDLEGVGGGRNALVDAVHLSLHAPRSWEDWTWARELLTRVVEELRAEPDAPAPVRDRLEAALFFEAMLRVHEALVWDGLPRPSPLRALSAWATPGRPREPEPGRLPLRMDWLRRLASPASAKPLLHDLRAV